MDASLLPSCSMTVKCEPDETDTDLQFKMKTEMVDFEETLIEELSHESPKKLKYSPPMDLTTPPFCSVTVKSELEEVDSDLSFKTSPKKEVDDLKEPVIQEFVTKIPKELKHSPEMDESPRPLCSVFIDGEPDGTDMDLSLKTEVVDIQETLIQELVPEFPKELKYSPPVDLSAHPLCSAAAESEPKEKDTGPSLKTLPRTEVEDLETEMPDDNIDGKSSDKTSPNCSLPSSIGGVGELHTKKNEVIAPYFLYFCSQCKSRFRSRYQLRRHLHSDHQLSTSKDEVIAPYFCSRCKSRFQNKCHFRSHLHSDHQIKPEDVTFSCSVCGEPYMKRKEFMKHILEFHLRANVLLCPVCRESFHTSWDLYEHLSKYSDDNSYSCPRCDQMFPTRMSLEQHMQTEEECTRKRRKIKFYDRSALNHHIKTHEEKILTCGVCCKLYSREHLLAEHISTHSEDDQLDCPKCGKKFATQSSLINHLRRHRSCPFPCETCNKMFFRQSDLLRHMATRADCLSLT